MASEFRTNRRRLLAAAGSTAAAAAFLGVNGVAEAAPGTGTRFSAAPRGVSDQEIKLLIRDDIKSAYAAEAAVELWQSQFPAKVTLDTPPAGADASQKIQ